MDVISSVVDLCKERDELEETVDRYEDWFSELIGKTVSVSVSSSRRHKKFIEVEIISFDPDGWMGQDVETGNEVLITWGDIVGGRVYIAKQ